MTIIGIGIDIVQISRINNLLLKYKDVFAQRILNKNELIKYYQINAADKSKFLAKRFAVKEAAAKAFGIGLRQGITFNQFQIYNNKLGKPKIKFFHKVLLLYKKIGAKHIHLTLTDEKQYACALVIIEK